MATKNDEKCVKIMKENTKNSIIEGGGPWERPSSARPKMPRAQRAKQFAPFDSLTGLYARLEQAEAEHKTERERK